MVTQSLISLREADSECGVGEGPIDEKSKSPPQAPVLDGRARNKEENSKQKKRKRRREMWERRIMLSSFLFVVREYRRSVTEGKRCREEKIPKIKEKRENSKMGNAFLGLVYISFFLFHLIGCLSM